MSVLLDAALKYARAGFVIFPLHNPLAGGACSCRRPECYFGGQLEKNVGKHPRITKWQLEASTDEARIKAWWDKWPEANIAIVTGIKSGLLVVDVDPRNGGVGLSVKTATVETGGGGYHYYFAYQPGLICGSNVFGPGLDCKTDGGYVVAPPSEHANGTKYKWTPGDSNVAQMSPALIELAKRYSETKRDREKHGNGSGEFEEQTYGEGERNEALVSLAGSMRRRGMTEGEISGALKTVNQNRCLPPLPEAEIEIIAKSVAKYTPGNEPGPGGNGPALGLIPAPMSGNSLAAACAMLRDSNCGPRLFPGAWPLTWDEMRLGVYGLGAEIRDSSITGARERAELIFATKFSGKTMQDAVGHVASEQPTHGVKDYLSGLVWDGIERIKDVASKILCIPDDDALSSILIRKWFVSAVARPLRPGCKVDTCLIFSGPEGVGKSSFFRILTGEDWHCDTPIQIDDSMRAAMTLRGCWVLEWAELQSALRARSGESIKSFLSSAIDKIKLPYAHMNEIIKRTCVVVGTTNKKDFIEYGINRRLWPIEITTKVNLNLLSAWRDQLWAESVSLLLGGEKWHLDQEDEMAVCRKRKNFEIEDPWSDLICDLLKIKDRTTTAECLQSVLGAARWERRDEMRVGQILRNFGWERKRAKVDDLLKWVYERQK